MSEEASFEEQTLATYFGGTAKMIDRRFFIRYSRDKLTTQLVHICNPTFWVKAHNRGASDMELVAYIHFPTKNAKTCHCKKSIPKRLWNTYLLATIGLNNG